MPPLDAFNLSCSQASLSKETSGTPLIHHCRARDEADSLRKEICLLRERLQEVEDERNFQAAKANELTGILKISKKEEVHEELVKKTIQVAELTAQIKKLNAEKEVMLQENNRIQNQRDSTRKEMQDLSVVVRSLQNSVCSMGEEHDSEDEEDEMEEIELTAEKALDMTLCNMKAHIEVLEDTLQSRTSHCKEQKKKIAQLQNDNEMNIVKVEMLEELFRELNQNRNDQEVRMDRKAAVEKASPERRLFQRAISVPTLNIGEKMKRGRSVKGNHSDAPSAASKSIDKSSKLSRTPVKMNKIMICFRKAGLEGTYTGPLMEGMPHGVGSIRFTNGDTYLGEMNRGQMSGKGTLYSKSTGVYRGEFRNNKYVGEICA